MTLEEKLLGIVNQLAGTVETLKSTQNEVSIRVKDERFAQIMQSVEELEGEVEDVRTKLEEEVNDREGVESRLEDLETKIQEIEGREVDPDSIPSKEMVEEAEEQAGTAMEKTTELEERFNDLESRYANLLQMAQDKGIV